MTPIPGFRMVRQLGDGGAAYVYDAIDSEQKRHVALKVLKPEHEHKPGVVRRFRNEARLAARLKHEAIVTLHRSSIHRPPYWIAYEYLAGGTLRDRLARGRLPLPEALRVFFTVCQALDYAHRQHVIHRDIKPSNILFGQDGRAYLIDFGISKDLDRTDHTQLGAQLGTLAYMSPERTWSAQMSRTSARATDIWSLGVVLFEMLTGRLPFPGPEPILVPQIRHSAPLPLSQFLHAPPELEWAINKALDKNPRRRHQSVADFARAVRGAVPASEPPAGRSERRRRRRPVRSRKLLFALLAVLAAIVIVAGVMVAASSAAPALGPVAGSVARTVPPLIGLPVARAEEQLFSVGCGADVFWQPSAEVPVNHVIRVEPPAGTIVEPRGVVTLYVSSGPPAEGGSR